ncbi:MAG: N-glycosylase/DNA lyase [Aigarchaeota archaeon]|nr:N-glycosylase/DNA lyase [Candidatus Calditenuis fumarioli]
MALERLLRAYEEVRGLIERRIAEFRSVDRSDPFRLFEELAFCVMTPQSKAKAALRAIDELKASGLLLSGRASEVAEVMRRNGIRFHVRKARYLVLNRRLLRGEPAVLVALLQGETGSVRDALVERVWGFGLKEASHFMRNVGFTGIAVLDRHVLRWMEVLGAIERVPRSLTRRTYLELEQRFLALSGELGMSPEELDLLLWYASTGEVLK